jgi:hypothetical protein
LKVNVFAAKSTETTSAVKMTSFLDPGMAPPKMTEIESISRHSFFP